MKTLLLAIFAVACLAGQAALAQAPLPKLSKAHHRVVPDLHAVEIAHFPSR